MDDFQKRGIVRARGRGWLRVHVILNESISFGSTFEEELVIRPFE